MDDLFIISKDKGEIKRLKAVLNIITGCNGLWQRLGIWLDMCCIVKEERGKWDTGGLAICQTDDRECQSRTAARKCARR